MARVPRLFVPAPWGADGSVELDGERAHRVARVLRLRAGDALRVFDGGGGEWAARVRSIEGRGAGPRVALALDGPVAPVPDPAVAVTLACALPRGQRGDWVVEKATELGVAAIVAVAAERAVLDPGAGRLERWRRVAVEAAEQCGRATVPEIRDAPGEAGPEAAPGTLALVCHPGAGATIAEVVAGGRPAAVAIHVGPEGGWSDGEVARLVAAGARAVTLGPRTLRVETAAVVALAQAMGALGALAPRGATD